LDGVASHRLAQVVYLVRLLIGAGALVASATLPDAPEDHRLALTIFIAVVYIPCSTALYALSRRGDSPSLGSIALVADLAVVFLFNTLDPQTRLIALFGYLLILAFHARLNGLGAGLAIAGAIMLLTAVAELLLAPGARFSAYTLLMYWAVLISMATLLSAAARAQSESNRRLKEAGDLLKQAQSVAGVGSWEWNVRTGEMRWSDEMYRIHGLPVRRKPLTLEEAVGPIIGEDRRAVAERIKSACRVAPGTALPDLEYRIVRPNGEHRFLYGRGRVISNGDGGPLRVVGTVQDMTYRKHMEDARAMQERNRLARELHDSVSQALFAITLHTRAAQLSFQSLKLGTEGMVGHHLSELQRLTQAALAEMKALIFELRPEALREEGLVAAIRKQVDALMARDELIVDLEEPSRPLVLAPKVEEELYRLAQEALGNAVKHARAERLRVRIVAGYPGPQHLMLEIADDGVGFDPGIHRPGHLGLRTMAQRAERIGGRLDVISSPGRGTVVRATVPFGSQNLVASPGALVANP
jgi:signal transduction histidine kinase